MTVGILALLILLGNWGADAAAVLRQPNLERGRSLSGAGGLKGSPAGLCRAGADVAGARIDVGRIPWQLVEFAGVLVRHCWADLGGSYGASVCRRRLQPRWLTLA